MDREVSVTCSFSNSCSGSKLEILFDFTDSHFSSVLPTKPCRAKVVYPSKYVFQINSYKVLS